MERVVGFVQVFQGRVFRYCLVVGVCFVAPASGACCVIWFPTGILQARWLRRRQNKKQCQLRWSPICILLLPVGASGSFLQVVKTVMKSSRRKMEVHFFMVLFF